MLTPRMEMFGLPIAYGVTKFMLGVESASLPTSVMPRFWRSWPVNTAIDSDTSCTDCERRCAVTTTSFKSESDDDEDTGRLGVAAALCSSAPACAPQESAASNMTTVDEPTTARSRPLEPS